MKIKSKQIEEGMTIQYRGHMQSSRGEGRLSVLCGTIKKSSPIVVVKDVVGLSQQFKNLREVTIITECGLRLEFSTRQSVIVVK